MKIKPKPRGDVEIFISYASADFALAIALRELIAFSLKLDRERVFVSGASLKLGKSDNAQINAAHQSAKIVIALMTPNSMFRPWVMYESGGAGFQKRKSLFVLLANGLTFNCLPSPLKFWEAENLEKPNCITNLLVALSSALQSGHHRKPSGEMLDAISRLASTHTGDWESVSTAIVADKASKSPFRLESIFDPGSPYQAKREIYTVGHNLYRLTVQEKFKDRIFEWLKGDEIRRMLVVIYDIKKREYWRGMRELFKGDFAEHLAHSTAVFEKWERQAKREGLKFFFKRIDFIPMTMLFVDPMDDSKSGYGVITPIAFELDGFVRPHIVLGASNNLVPFEYYWASFHRAVIYYARPKVRKGEQVIANPYRIPSK